jgi:hypothetical protein
MITALRATPRFASLAAPRPMPPDWTRQAACRYWPDLDWIDPTPEQARDCRLLCAGCPVRWRCLAAALVTAEPWGIWGGLDVDERADLARTYGFPAPRVVPAHGVHARYLRHRCRCGACRYVHALYARQRRRINRMSRAGRARASAG